MSKRKRFHCDEETGEIITFQINEETGEPAIINDIENFTFNLDKNPITCSFLNLQERYVRKYKKIKTLKEQNTNGSILTRPRMFLLIATVMFIPSCMSAFLILLETFLHIGCHIKNKYLEDLNMYYLRPFHFISSIFFGLCRECDTSSKI